MSGDGILSQTQSDELWAEQGHGRMAALLRDTNNSMPIADKPYDPPPLPEEIDAYKDDLSVVAKHYRETLRPVRRDYVTMFFRVRRRCCEQLLWQLLSSGVLTKEDMYSPRKLPYWTVSVKMRLRRSYPMGRVMQCMKERLGITNPGLRFCLDGFFGMVNYSDIFGTTTDSCPWMEISNFSTVTSLRLADGDSIFISIATIGQIQNVAAWRKKHDAEVAAAAMAAAAAAAKSAGPGAPASSMVAPESEESAE